jgi:hypothetical protein
MALVQVMRDFLTAPEWGFGPGPTDSTFVTHYQGDNGDFVAVCSVREDEDQLVFYAFAPGNTAPEQLAPMMELVTRANHGMILGNFELDLSDGEVRYKVAVDVEVFEDPTIVVKTHLAACIMTLDQYLPAIDAVQSGQSSALEALQVVEGAE